ncbi:hypothetical protein CDV36_013107 [Fusarium kuroshium]|uniref:Zn(2)-C6 fungal-type domain-containing protein n=1 Tax=Fusarium kuroshium TaxID=2010991 RepID=A0A3M2RPM6_9HYPO|nr:hypothetical protein CDV36_013107 [Fusarium kuroshium]
MPVTTAQFANAVNFMCEWLETRLSPSSTTVVGYTGPNDLRCFILILAGAKTGTKVLLCSSRNSLEGKLALIQQSNCQAWLSSSEGDAQDILGEHPMPSFVIPNVSELIRAEPVPVYPYEKSFLDARWDLLAYLHTSGSTGNPKLIPMYLGAVACVDALHLIAPEDGKRPTAVEWASSTLLCMMPLFHMSGIAGALYSALMFDWTIVLPPPGPISMTLIERLLDSFPMNSAFIPPSILNEMAKSTDALNKLAALDLVISAGGPVAPFAGDIISRHTNLQQIMGSTEGHWYATLPTKRPDWAYFQFSSQTGYEMVPDRDGLHELVFKRQPHLDLTQPIFMTFPKLNVWHTQDLYLAHPETPELWKFEGRKDDLLILSNGMKINPLGAETQLSKHPAIQAACLSGSGKFQVAALIQLANGFSTNDEATLNLPQNENSPGVVDDVRALLSKYTFNLQPEPKGTRVILTGSTGFLGSYLLDTLVADPQVSEVWCLNRSQDALQKQIQSAKDKSLRHDWGSKVKFYTAQLGLPDWRLGAAEYRTLLKGTAHVIHNAWQVNFNLSVWSFESQIAGVSNLIQFCSEARNPVHVCYISSIGVATNWSATHVDPVPEALVQDASAPRTGYGASKMVAENLLYQAASADVLRLTVCRVGQMSGPVLGDSDHGVWNPKEWLPTLIGTSSEMRALPEDFGNRGNIDWVPIDLATQIISEMLFNSNISDEAGPQFFHVINPNTIRWKSVLPLIRERLQKHQNLPVDVLSFNSWVRKLQNTSGNMSPISEDGAFEGIRWLKLLEFYESIRLPDRIGEEQEPSSVLPPEYRLNQIVTEASTSNAMVNIPGRSRGCATCRKRRVKCDESLPECLACVRMRLPCPGARTGSFFVHAVPRSYSSNEACSPALRIPGAQPSRASAFDQLFVSHFVESFFGTMKPPPTPGPPSKIWLHELPVFLTSSGSSSAKPAIRAASMISYGTLAGDVSIKTAARRWYAEALHHLQCQITKGNVSVDDSIICAVVMLIHFETWAGTSRKAWLRHLKGAAMLLQVAGPERCSRGFMHQVFSHLRFQMFVAAMTENEVPIFASQDWMTIPFRIYPKLIFDQLIDVLFSVLKCLSIADQLIKFDDKADLRATLDALISDTMLQSSQWWLECVGSSIFGQISPKQGCGPDEAQLLLTHTSVPAAALCSLYDAANMIAFRLLHLVSSSGSSHDLQVRQHAQSILSASHFIDEVSGPAPDRGSIMITLQLKVVSLWSPSSEQRNMALALLERDKHQKGGLSDISAVSDEYFADVAAYILRQYTRE